MLNFKFSLLIKVDDFAKSSHAEFVMILVFMAFL